MLAIAEVKWGVYKAVDELFGHIANGRHRETIACFTEDPDVALLGSEAGEAAVGPIALRKFFADLYARPYRIIFTLSERTVSAAGNVAWFTGTGDYRLDPGGEASPYRLTGVLERRRERWLWQLWSGSEPR